MDEPFAGMFTQGMVTHESYRTAGGPNGVWLYPEEVVKQPDGSAVVRDTKEPVIVGRVEAMSKSRRNTVDPGAIIARYGADTARWFILSDNPPERDMEWTEAGVAGAFRFTQRVFRLAESFDLVAAEQSAGDAGPATRALRHATHRTIAAVTDALESFAFNVAVARLYEFTNAIGDAERAAEHPGLHGARREALETLSRLVSPMMPHLAEEVHARLHPGSTELVAEQPWPQPDPVWLATDSVTIAVQVMGKLRGTIAAPPDAPAEQVIAMAEAEPNVARALLGKRMVKRIHVPNRIVNFVVAG
jgi:leucyl-tRNA synthetase